MIKSSRPLAKIQQSAFSTSVSHLLRLRACDTQEMSKLYSFQVSTCLFLKYIKFSFENFGNSSEDKAGCRQTTFGFRIENFFLYFGHKHVETGPNCLHELATFFKNHMPLKTKLEISERDILKSGKSTTTIQKFLL